MCAECEHKPRHTSEGTRALVNTRAASPPWENTEHCSHTSGGRSGVFDNVQHFVHDGQRAVLRICGVRDRVFKSPFPW